MNEVEGLQVQILNLSFNLLLIRKLTLEMIEAIYLKKSDTDYRLTLAYHTDIDVVLNFIDLGFGLVLNLVNFDFVVNLTALGLGSNPGLGLNLKIFQNFLANQLRFGRKYFLKKYFSFLFQKY
jgi:hypothetical protein